MSFLSILKNIGSSFGVVVTKLLQVEAAALPLEKQIAGTVSVFNPGAGMSMGVGIVTIEELLGILGDVEQVATAVGAASGTGPQKLAVAAPRVEAALLQSPVFKGKTIADTAKWNASVIGITSSLVDLANSVEAAATPVTPVVKAAAPAVKAVDAPPADAAKPEAIRE